MNGHMDSTNPEISLGTPTRSQQEGDHAGSDSARCCYLPGGLLWVQLGVPPAERLDDQGSEGRGGREDACLGLQAGW